MYEKLESALYHLERVDWDNYLHHASMAKQLILEYIEEGYKIKETNPLGD